jgi:hypothetical protein
MNEVRFWLIPPYDALTALPYFWLKVALGIATGLFIPSRIVGLLACALECRAYTSAGSGESLPMNVMALLM